VIKLKSVALAFKREFSEAGFDELTVPDFWFCEVALLLSPYMLVVASFFVRGLYFEPLAFWGCLFFHRRSLF
jgi:hypothetical protein